MFHINTDNIYDITCYIPSTDVVEYVTYLTDFNWMVTVLALLSKGAIKLAFISIMVYTGELFPTPVRHLAIGSSSMISRVGGIIAPYMGEPLVGVYFVILFICICIT